MSATRIGLVQLTAEETPAANLKKTIPRIEEAAAKGAKIIGLQEMFTTKYFCTTQDPRFFDLAEPIETGPTVTELARVASRLGVVIIAPLFEARGSEVYHNTAAVIDADGTVLGKYGRCTFPKILALKRNFILHQAT
jgi:N-carbamoylputrescine amidase